MITSRWNNHRDCQLKIRPRSQALDHERPINWTQITRIENTAITNQRVENFTALSIINPRNSEELEIKNLNKDKRAGEIMIEAQNVLIGVRT